MKITSEVFWEVWNRDGFGHVSFKITFLEDRMVELEQDVLISGSDDAERDLLAIKSELHDWVHREEILLAQKAKNQVDARRGC